MSPWGHHAIGLAVGVTGAWVLSSGELSATVGALTDTVIDIARGIWHGNFTGTMSTMTEGAAFLTGAVLGGRAPDKLEIAKWWLDKRYSLIPHRTLTHWWPLWVGLLVWSIVLIQDSYGFTDKAISWGLLGFALSGVLHLVFDVMTPTGIPLVSPFGDRFSLKVYRSGSIAELPIVGATGVLCLAVALIWV